MQQRFKPEFVALISERKKAYTLVFGGADVPHRRAVLDDLAFFCREKRSCFHEDPRIHAALEGRREVMLRIRDYVELSVDQLCQKYGKASSLLPSEKE